MAASKKFSLGVIFASATLTNMAGSIIAAVPEPAIEHQATPQSNGRTSVFKVFRGSPVLSVIYGLMFFGNILLYSTVIFLPQLLLLLFGLGRAKKSA